MIEVTETTDIALLASLNKDVHTLHHVMHPNIFKPFNEIEIANHLTSTFKTENVKAFVAKVNGNIAGYVLVFIQEFPENAFQYARKLILIDQILVLENSRKQGVGKALVNAVVELTHSLNINRIDLTHWTSNDGARAFFGRNGFEYFHERMWKLL